MQASALAHPNVALIKYWGKRDTVANLPATGSLSLTLGGLATKTHVKFSSELTADVIRINGQPDRQAARRVTICLDQLRTIAGQQQFAAIESTNDFPTGAGLASSASGYAALVVAAASALGIDASEADLVNIARQGSGSAPRSLFDGIVLLDAAARDRVHCESLASADAWPLAVVVAITSREPKAIGSTEGMERSRLTSPYYDAWVSSHQVDLDAAVACVAQRDFEQLAELSEFSCLKMHALAQSARPGLVYWNAATVACIEIVRDLRKRGVPVCFTIDAGPQLKAVCLPEAVDEVSEALGDCPGVLELLHSGLGVGAHTL